MAVGAGHHVGIVVSDAERTAAWQERIFGARRELTSSAGRTVLMIGRTRVLLESAEAGRAPASSRADEVGAFHVCVAVPDVGEAEELIRAEGFEPSTPPAEILPGLWSLYFRDGDGVQYQLLQVEGARAVHHVAYSVADLDETLAWYAQAFGAEPTYRSESSAPLVSRMLDVDEESSYRVALIPMGDIQLELMEWQSGRAAAGSPAPGSWHLGVAATDLAPAAPVSATEYSFLTDPDGHHIHVHARPTLDPDTG